jgi:hypothetical protein
MAMPMEDEPGRNWPFNRTTGELASKAHLRMSESVFMARVLEGIQVE